MTKFRTALLGAGLALPLLAAAGHAQTATPEGGRTITVPPGAVVLILPGTVAASPVVNGGAPEMAPMLQMIAQQQAAMQRMIANMNALFPPMPDPTALLRAGFGAGGPMLAVTGGHGVCSQSISIVQNGNNAPIVHVSQTGDACGPSGATKPLGVDHVRPEAPVPPPHGPKVLEVSYPPLPLGTPPHT